MQSRCEIYADVLTFFCYKIVNVGTRAYTFATHKLPLLLFEGFGCKVYCCQERISRGSVADNTVQVVLLSLKFLGSQTKRPRNADSRRQADNLYYKSGTTVAARNDIINS